MLDPALFEEALTRVAADPVERGSLRALLTRLGVPATVRALGALARSARYEPEPARQTLVPIGGRARVVLRSSGVDAVLERALARHLTARLEPHLHDALHSYRAGRSAATALRQLARRVRSLRAENAGADLYVLRRDVRSYGEAIRTGETSSLWGALARVLPHEPAVQRLLRAFVRRRYSEGDDGGAVRTWETGAPNGSYLQPAVNNLYLASVDEELARSAPGYARYGDDLFVLASSADSARALSDTLDARVGALGLAFGEKKRGDFVLVRNGGAGREAGFEPAYAVEFLGYALGAHGTVRLATRHGRDLVRLVRGRLHAAMRWVAGAPRERRIELAVGVMRDALDERGALAWPRVGQLRAVDDRSYLAHLDGLFALAAAEAVTGVRGARAFREVPPHALVEAGAPSLVRRSNRRPR